MGTFFILPILFSILIRFYFKTTKSMFVFLQIYTDWANHYLEKARSKKRVNSLAADCSDGVLLAEVIESVSKYITFLYVHK